MQIAFIEFLEKLCASVPWCLTRDKAYPAIALDGMQRVLIECRQPLDAEHFPGWPGFGVTVAMDQQYPVAKTPGQSGFVQHHGDARATIARCAGKQFEHGNLVFQVKVGNRLIKQKQLRRLGEQRGNGQSLTFATRKRLVHGALSGTVSQPRICGQLAHVHEPANHV